MKFHKLEVPATIHERINALVERYPYDFATKTDLESMCYSVSARLGYGPAMVEMSLVQWELGKSGWDVPGAQTDWLETVLARDDWYMVRSRRARATSAIPDYLSYLNRNCYATTFLKRQIKASFIEEQNILRDIRLADKKRKNAAQ